jgi:hypothetical protein
VIPKTSKRREGQKHKAVKTDSVETTKRFKCLQMFICFRKLSFVSNLWIILKQTMPSMPGIVKKGTIWSAHGTNFYFFFGVSQSVENANVSLIASNSIVSQMRQTIHHSCNIVFQIQWFPKNHLSPGGFWRMWLCNTKIFEGGK